jgi:hypothetical protein
MRMEGGLLTNNESRMKQLSFEIENIRNLLNREFQRINQLSDPRIYDISVKLDRKIMEYEEMAKNAGLPKGNPEEERSGYG